MLDQANEAVELELRESISTDDEISLDGELKEAAVRISNEMMMLSLGFSIEDSDELAGLLGGDNKLTDEVTDGSLGLISEISALAESGVMNDGLKVRLISGVLTENSENFVSDDITEVIQNAFDDFVNFNSDNSDAVSSYYDSMIQLYEMLIDNENSKDEPNESLISNFESAMESFESAKNSL